MTQALARNNRYRYERKYISESLLPHQLETFILTNPGFFRRIFHPRRVFSIYFDTPELDYYQQNILDSRSRKKIRLRWYQYRGLNSPLRLEVKLKDGEVNKKIRYPLSGSITSTSLVQLTRVVRQKLDGLVPEAASLQPVVVVSYQRQYFASSYLQIRITLDSDLCFQTINDWQKAKLGLHLPLTILECKYRLAEDPHLEELVQSLPLRITKFSKYLVAMEQCLC